MKILVLILLTSSLMLTTSLLANEIEQSKVILDRVNQKAASTQSNVDKLATQADVKLTEYRKIVQKTESVNNYNEQLQSLINSQTQELASLQSQIDELENTHRDIIPLIDSMISGLAEFIALDVPFLPVERQQRLTELQAMMKRADVTVSEKYRRVLEAYMTEVEYGNTIEAYEHSLQLDGKSLNVEFLRVGRIALIYKTRDDQTLGFWDRSSQQWQALPADYLPFVRKGLKVARKQAAPDLLTVPVKLLEVL